MNFEILEKFEWYNEPDNVRFDNSAMMVYAKKGTDFWQSGKREEQKDNGHFFFCRQEADFELLLEWKVDDVSFNSQCGIMLRVDEKNWFKASVVKDNGDNYLLGAFLTINGHTDRSEVRLDKDNRRVWFGILREKNDYVAFASLDGIKYIKLREFFLEGHDSEVKVGAYISSKDDEGFCAQLSDLKLIFLNKSEESIA